MLAKVVVLFVACLAWVRAQAELDDCKDPNLCGPIRTNKTGLEFIGFALSQDPANYEQFDWTKVTTVVIVNVGSQTKDFASYAHSKNTKMTLLVTTSTAVLQNDALRKKFVIDCVKNVVDYGLDGINVDFEGNIYINTTAYNGLTDLMRELRVALQNAKSTYTLSMDYVFCPECIVGRTYNYKEIQKYVDYFIIMFYDMLGTQETTTSLCSKLVNAPYWVIYQQTLNFIKAGVSPQKLVMAFPWYGYSVPCAKFNVTTQTCYTDCKNLNGNSQFSYSSIMDNLRDKSMDGRWWNPKTLTPFYTFSYLGKLYQVNYDDPWSLRHKYQLAIYLKVRGMGTWNLNCLNYANNPQRIAERDLMWSVIPIAK